MKTRKFYLQREPKDNLFSAARNLTHYLKIKIDIRDLYRRIKIHPKYPSSEVLSDFFKGIGAEEMTIKIDTDKLYEIPLPALALFEGEQNLLVMIYKIKDNYVEYIHPGLGWIIETLEEFSLKWKGVCFVVILPSKGININYNKINESVARKLVPKTNKVKTKANFLTKEECDYIINFAKPRLKKSDVTIPANPNDPDYENKVEFYKKGRNNSETAFINNEDCNDPILYSVRSKISKLLSVPVEYMEPFQFTHYKKGGEFKYHVDTGAHRTQEEIIHKGERCCAMIIYLNDNFKGGATHFPNLDLCIQPKIGTLAWFFLVNSIGETDNDLIHAGLPVIEGEKSILNILIRDRVLYL